MAAPALARPLATPAPKALAAPVPAKAVRVAPPVYTAPATAAAVANGLLISVQWMAAPISLNGFVILFVKLPQPITYEMKARLMFSVVLPYFASW